MKYTQLTKNKCRCGVIVEDCIKEVQCPKDNYSRTLAQRIIKLDCSHCGLNFRSPDYKNYEEVINLLELLKI